MAPALSGRARLPELRSGGIELVDTYGVQRIHAPKPVLFPLSLERDDVVAFIRHWSETILGPLGVSLPRVACLSVTGIKGFVLLIDERPSFLPKLLFDRDTVSFRPVVLDAAEDVEQSLKPMFDALWQAAGGTGASDTRASEAGFLMRT